MSDRPATKSEVDEKEIEVTPEMIEAGMEEYIMYWRDLCDADDDAAREMFAVAYRAMFRASLLSV